jgi:hypothetical protein
MGSTAYHLTNRVEYFHELQDFARSARGGDRIVIATMSFDPTAPPLAELSHELAAAAARGVKVLLWVDAFTFLSKGIGKLHVSATATEPFGSRFAALEDLRNQGGTYIITNKPLRSFSFAKAGRSHIKFAVLNDRVYIGGNNLERPEQIDIMAGWHNKATADYLSSLAIDVAKAGSPHEALHNQDVRMQLDNGSALLIDAGVPGQSLILSEALQLIDNAKDWICMTCQYFPGGQTGNHLAAALRRGVQVTLYYSPARSHGKEAPGHFAYERWERLQLPRELFVHRLPATRPKLHAKVLTTEQGAMLGSHNYAVQGVRFGTAEIALRDNSPVFSNALRTAIVEQIET